MKAYHWCAFHPFSYCLTPEGPDISRRGFAARSRPQRRTAKLYLSAEMGGEQVCFGESIRPAIPHGSWDPYGLSVFSVSSRAGRLQTARAQRLPNPPEAFNQKKGAEAPAP